MNTITRYRDRPGSLLMLALAVVIALPLSGCKGILDVFDPDIVTPGSLESDVGLQTLRNGALGEFTVAYSGGSQTDGVIMIGGLFTDEWMHSGTFTSRFRVETRNIDLDNGTSLLPSVVETESEYAVEMVVWKKPGHPGS